MTFWDKTESTDTMTLNRTVSTYINKLTTFLWILCYFIIIQSYFINTVFGKLKLSKICIHKIFDMKRNNTEMTKKMILNDYQM